MKIDTKILRKNKTFLDAKTKEIIETFSSISKAKKESRILQMQNGGLGRGYIQTIDTRTKADLNLPKRKQTVVFQKSRQLGLSLQSGLLLSSSIGNRLSLIESKSEGVTRRQPRVRVK